MRGAPGWRFSVPATCCGRWAIPPATKGSSTNGADSATARAQLHRRFPDGVLVCDRQSRCRTARVDEPRTDRAACRRRRRVAWVPVTISADAGRVAEAVALAEPGYSSAARSLDAPQMAFIIADSHVRALLLAGRIGCVDPRASPGKRTVAVHRSGTGDRDADRCGVAQQGGRRPTHAVGAHLESRIYEAVAKPGTYHQRGVCCAGVASRRTPTTSLGDDRCLAGQSQRSGDQQRTGAR